jgi:hypothetical protein
MDVLSVRARRKGCLAITRGAKGTGIVAQRIGTGGTAGATRLRVGTFVHARSQWLEGQGQPVFGAYVAALTFERALSRHTSGPTRPGVWGCWLPVWLPEISLAVLMSEWLGIRASPNVRLQPRPHTAQLDHPGARQGHQPARPEMASASRRGLVAPHRMADAARNAIVTDCRQRTAADQSYDLRFKRSFTPSERRCVGTV